MELEITLDTNEFELCNFEDKDHCKILCDLINEYISDPMGGGEAITSIKKLRLLDGLESHPTSLTLFVKEGEEIAGLLVGFFNFSTFMVKPMLNIHDVIISKEYRNKGLGRKLINQATKIAKDNGCGKVTLEVRHDNEHAQKLYRSEDFSEGEYPMHFLHKRL